MYKKKYIGKIYFHFQIPTNKFIRVVWKHRSYYYRMKGYLYDFWNVVDLLSYALLLAALLVRHFYINESFTIARRMFALSLLVMYLRFLEVFLIHRKLGPTLIMIKEMVYTLVTQSLFEIATKPTKTIHFYIIFIMNTL